MSSDMDGLDVLSDRLADGIDQIRDTAADMADAQHIAAARTILRASELLRKCALALESRVAAFELARKAGEETAPDILSHDEEMELQLLLLGVSQFVLHLG